jgi:hypothetical protein
MSTRTARGRRVRDLFEGFLARVGGTDADIVTKAQCLKVAELTYATEGLRARLETADNDPTTDAKTIVALVNAMTRAESTARRASADLAKSVPVKPKGSMLAELLASKHGKPKNA